MSAQNRTITEIVDRLVHLSPVQAELALLGLYETDPEGYKIVRSQLKDRQRGV